MIKSQFVGRVIETDDLNIICKFCYRCAEGYMGPRCEYKDLDGSYLRKLCLL